MPRVRAPKETGHVKRMGASVAASLLVHGAIALALAGVVYRLAEASTHERGADVMMTLRSAAGADYMAKRHQIGPSLDNLLKDAGPLNNLPIENTGKTLDDAIREVDSASPGTGITAAVTGESGTSAALGKLPAGTGVVFAGLRATGEQARSVVYVVDASGPMVSSLADVLAEVSRSVEDLLPTQRFGVVVFRDNSTAGGTQYEVFDNSLRDATSRNRVELRGWMAKIKATGRSNPMVGLRTGLAMHPQVIFLLSRSITRTSGGVWELGPDATLAELERLNSADGDGRRATVIKTIQFQEPDGTGTMERIAKAHGGNGAEPAYRVMKREELGRR